MNEQRIPKNQNNKKHSYSEMDDVDLQLNFAMCFDHFQHNDAAKEEQYKTPLGGSKDNSPNDNESESIEVVDTPSNPYKGPMLQESTISSASSTNNDICVLDSHFYTNDDLHFLPDDDLDEKEFLESDDGDEVFLRCGNNEDFTLLRKPVKSRRLCKCEESTEVLLLINSEYQEEKHPTYSGTDSDVEVLMSEEVVESDWSSGNNEGKIEKSLTFESGPDLKDEEEVSSSHNQEESTDSSDISQFANLNRAQLLEIIQQQEIRIQALEATVERYHKAQQRLFEHVDALRIELSEIRITPVPMQRDPDIKTTLPE